MNAIGNSYTNSNQKCDYWGTTQGSAAEPTAIFIVWDDWGGFFDHIKPPNIWTGTANGNSWICPAPNQWGCGYTYGFRVPLLVVSEFTGTSLGNGQYGGYISGSCTTNCPNRTAKYQHDFGSILAFTEYNFNLKLIDQSGNNGYADRNALDSANGNLPLSDFFGLYAGQGSNGRPFVEIPVNSPASFFQTYYGTHNAVPTGPDTD